MSGALSDAESAFVIIIFLFGFGSMVGWCIELLFRRFISRTNKERKWINPGFLVGPCLPIYGFGLVALFFFSLLPYVGEDGLSEPTWLKIVIAIIGMGIMMTVIEYIAGIIFIKHMKLKLWDYSDEWGNIQGIICPLFSLIWTALGGAYYFFVQPHIVKMVMWLYENVGFIFVIGMYFGILLIDMGYSFKVAGKIKRYARDNAIIVKYEELKNLIKAYNEENDVKQRFFSHFKNAPIIEIIEEHKDKIVATGKRAKEKVIEVGHEKLKRHKDKDE